MTTFHVVRGDTRDYIIVDCNGIDDITGATTITGHVRNTIATPTSATLTGTIENGLATATEPCSVRLSLGAAAGWLDTVDRTGVWKLQTKLTWADGTLLTWPSDGTDRIVVADDLAT